MASEADFLTTHKNGVIAITGLNQTLDSFSTSLIDQTNYYKGKSTSGALSSQTLISAGSGFLVSFSVTVAGSAAGTINNSATTGAVAAGNVVAAVPATVGIYPVGARFTSGLVVTPGTGQSIAVTYSLD